MPIFIILCIVIAIIVEAALPIQKLIVNEYVVYLGLTSALLIILGNFLKKIPELLSYDFFSSSLLITWFALWKPLFVADSPIFFYFPVYFALITALAMLFFISQRDKIDQNNLKLMQSIEDSGVADSWLIMLLGLITLYFENHFLQYPVMMTLLITRFTLSGCLKPIDLQDRRIQL